MSNNKYTKVRLTALLCAFMFIFSMVMAGCSVGKITKKDVSATDDGLIQVGSGVDSLEGESQIVVGSDGKSYLVDSEGNSVLYDATSALLINQPTAATQTTTTKKSSNGGNSGNGGSNNSSATTKSTTESTTQAKGTVYNALAAQRKFGFNKAYDKYSGLANFYLDTIRCYFIYDNKYWLVEFWKGEYAMAAVGCEIGLYYAEMNTANNNLWNKQGPEYLHYGMIADDDAMYMTMELYQYKKADSTEPVHMLSFTRRLCWWAAAFENGVLYKHSDRTSLVMIGSIEFPTTKVRDLFIDQLEERGFKEGSISTYKNVERYAVDGKKVTVCWKNYDEDRRLDG